ncbi:MAG: hypothetical protein OQL19_20840 [Gammaproteobacteria bacterium]|nr:hypothetical protein [Gammaproteobacteria bacterium]
MLQLLFVIEVLMISYVLFYKKELIFRPSIVFSLVFLVRISFAAAFYEFFQDFYLSLDWSFDVYVFRLLTVIFPFFIVFLVALINLPIANVRPVLKNSPRVGGGFFYSNLTNIRLFLFFLFIILLFSTVLLLNEVPFNKTGLYATLFDPGNTLSARENTLKFLSNRNVKVLYSFVRNSIVYVFVGLAIILFYTTKIKWEKLLSIGIILFSIFFVMIEGAKAPAGKLLIYIGVVGLILKGNRNGLLKFAFLIISALLIVYIMVFLKFARDGLDSMYLFQFVLHRAFVAPFETGLWHYEYAIENGFWGFSAITFPLKGHLGIESYESYGIVGAWKAYNIGGPESTWMNTSVLFTHISNFDYFIGIFLASFLVVFFDIISWVEFYMPRFLAYTFRALLLISVISLVSTDFFGVFWGILYSLVFLFIVHLFVSSLLILNKKAQS